MVTEIFRQVAQPARADPKRRQAARALQPRARSGVFRLFVVFGKYERGSGFIQGFAVATG